MGLLDCEEVNPLALRRGRIASAAASAAPQHPQHCRAIASAAPKACIFGFLLWRVYELHMRV